MKDPAVLFYTADFLIGVSDLTDEECGKYIKLLCLQHQKGHLSEKQICLFFSLTYEEHMKNICSTYVQHMENENENINENVIINNHLIIDPYNSKEKNIFEKIYEKVFGKKPFLTNENCLNFSELASKHKDFFETLEENLIKVSKLDFKQIGYKPGADWFLNPKNYVALRNGAYDEQIKEREYINDGFSY